MNLNWYCLYLKPKQANIVSFYMRNAGIEYLYPICSYKKYEKGKTLEVFEELFPRYFFVRSTYQMVPKLRYFRGVLKIIGDSHGNPFAVQEEVIESIRGKMIDGVIKIGDKKFEKGDKVRITSGPFENLEAVFLEYKNANDRVNILLNLLNTQVVVEVEVGVLRKYS